jgi:hypothetical protein
MENTKLNLARGLAIASTISLLIFLINTVGGLLPPTGRGLVFPVAGMLLAAAAFGISWRQKSVLISVLLLLGGTIQAVNAIIATRNFSIIIFPGPITGVIVGLAIVGLGIVKSISKTLNIRTERTT